MSFNKGDLLKKRYELVLRPGAGLSPEPKDTEESEGRQSKTQEYAAFLRDKERKAGRDGFVDSYRQRNSYSVKQDGSKKEDRETPRKAKSMTAVDLAVRKEQEEKGYEKRLKCIEDYMWQHKQGERELKRIEGDVIKNQRSLRRALSDYENGIARKRMAEEKKLNQGMEKYTVLQHQHLHKREEQTRNRTEANVTTEQQHKGTGRKTQLITSQNARLYRTKKCELEAKKAELERIERDFENKFRKKEVVYHCHSKTN